MYIEPVSVNYMLTYMYARRQIFQLQFGFCCCASLCGGAEEGFLTSGHGHSHGSLPGGGGSKANDVNDHMNVRAACLHIIGDSLFGFGLMVGALIIYFKASIIITCNIELVIGRVLLVS